MLIDPFTVIAQIVNFAILAFALKRLLYGRVIEAMDRREASIAARLELAEQREAAAEIEATRYREERDRLDRQRRERLDDVRLEVADHRQRLLGEARAEVEAERSRWVAALEADRRDHADQLQHRAAEQILGLSRQALADLADVDLERLVVAQGLAELASDAEVVDELLRPHDEGALVVTTAFPLPADQRRQVTERLRSLGLAPDRAIRFAHDPALVLGIEFRGDGTSVGWNAADYLDRLGDVIHGLDPVHRVGERRDGDGH